LPVPDKEFRSARTTTSHGTKSIDGWSGGGLRSPTRPAAALASLPGRHDKAKNERQVDHDDDGSSSPVPAERVGSAIQKWRRPQANPMNPWAHRKRIAPAESRTPLIPQGKQWKRRGFLNYSKEIWDVVVVTMNKDGRSC
jgi:hypothetical protein